MTEDSLDIELLKSLKTKGLLGFLAGALATWRLTELFLDEEAPFGLASKLRDYIKVQAKSNSMLFIEAEKAIACPWCLSVWLGWSVAILQFDKRWFLTGFAYSAVSVLIKLTVHRFLLNRKV